MSGVLKPSGDNVEHMPAFRCLARILAGAVFLDEAVEDKVAEEVVEFLTGVVERVAARGPAIAVAEDLAREASAGRNRFDDPPPYVVERLPGAEREGVRRVEQVAGGDSRVFERGEDELDAISVGQVVARLDELKGLLVRVDGDDAPSSPQEFRGVPALAAAEIHGETRLRRRLKIEEAEGFEEGVSRGLAGYGAEVSRPVSALGVILRFECVASAV